MLSFDSAYSPPHLGSFLCPWLMNDCITSGGMLMIPYSFHCSTTRLE